MRGGDAYADSTGVDYSGKCQGGYILCNPSASTSNRVCRSSKSECPITQISFVDSSTK
jgi:hypothetical protein